MNNNREVYMAGVLSVTHAHHCTTECLRNSFTFNVFKVHVNEHCKGKHETDACGASSVTAEIEWDRALTAGTLVRELLGSLCCKKQRTGVVLVSYLFASSSYQSSIITALQLLISEKTDEAKERREGFVH
jgi:hypothetical protein